MQQALLDTRINTIRRRWCSFTWVVGVLEKMCQICLNLTWSERCSSLDFQKLYNQKECFVILILISHTALVPHMADFLHREARTGGERRAIKTCLCVSRKCHKMKALHAETLSIHTILCNLPPQISRSKSNRHSLYDYCRRATVAL